MTFNYCNVISIFQQQEIIFQFEDLLQRSFIGLVVQPPKPSGRNHGSVIVNTMLGIVDHPSAIVGGKLISSWVNPVSPVPAPEVGRVGVVLVAHLICAHMCPNLDRKDIINFVLSGQKLSICSTLRSSVQ